MILMKTRTIAQRRGRRSLLPIFCIAFILILALPAAVSATAPVANFSATPVSGNSPLAVTFTDTSVNATSWAWDFGDGMTSTVQNPPAHTYLIAGNYTVKLTATNGDGSNTLTRANYITARCNLYIGGVLNPIAGTVFANENNTLVISLVKNDVGNSPATEMLVTASDGWSGRAPVAAMNSTGSQAISITDPTLRTTQGSVTYTYKIDPDNVVPETDETTNQQKTITKPVRFNGYKGVQYWDSSKEAPKTYLTYDLHGNIVHSFGNSYYKSGKEGDAWSSLTWKWGYNATNPIDADIVIPAGATVKAARLYIPYCWDHEQEVGTTTTTTFNGVLVTPVHWETDTSNFGPTYADYTYGLITYNVTDLYLKNATNTVVFTRQIPGGSLSPAGFTLAVVYEDPSETRRQIFINEGWDLLGASTSSYATTEEEATSYQYFTGMTIDMGTAVKASLTTFVPWGAPQNVGEPGEGKLYVNGNLLGSRWWNYGNVTGGWGENGMPQVAVNTTSVLNYLNPSGAGNGIAIRSEQGGSPCMVAERSFLVVEYPATGPVAAFTASNFTPTVGQTITFTDQSTGSPTSWLWNFGDGNTSTARNPTHTYVINGTKTVVLTATNAGGSDSETKTNYISVTGRSLVTLPGIANLPTDPDYDVLYEDLNANGKKDSADVVLFFKNRNWMSTNEPIVLFDFNNNKALDTADVIMLFKKHI